MSYDFDTDCALIIGGSKFLHNAIKKGIGTNGTYCSHHKTYQQVLNDDITGYEPFPNIIFLRLDPQEPKSLEVLQFLKNGEGIKYIPLVAVVNLNDEVQLKLAYSNFANCCLELETEEEAFAKRISDMWGFWKEIAQLPSQIIPKI